jgi:hypothetical protein
MEINFGLQSKITAAVGIKRRHRPFREDIRTEIVNDLTSRGIKPENINVSFHEKGLTGVKAEFINLRYKLDSTRRPVMINA